MRNRSRNSTILCAGLSLLIAINSSHAQRIEPVAVTLQPPVDSSVSRTPREPINSTGGIVGGLVGGVVGMYAGAMLGNAMSKGRTQCDDCGYVLLAAVVGESIGLATGTHYGARGNANVGVTSLASAGIGVAGVFAAFGAPILAALVPVAQLAVVLAMERPD